MAGVGEKARATVRNPAGETAGDRNRHLGVGVAVPEHDRNADVGQAKAPRPAEERELMDCAMATRAQSFAHVVDQPGADLGLLEQRASSVPSVTSKPARPSERTTVTVWR